MAQGTITKQDREFVETWENVVAQGNTIIRLDPRGVEKPELIWTKRTFMVTTEERLVTEDRILDVKNNPFQNGCFRPLVVPETVTITTNPNTISDETVVNLFRATETAWVEWLKVIDSPDTLRRMMDLAEESDDLTLRRYKQLARRLAEVRPPRQITQKDRDQYESMNGAPVEPRKHQPEPRRGMGGRSSDYRS